MTSLTLNLPKLAVLCVFLFFGIALNAQIEICNDGIDNDGDNLVDNFDLDCSCQNPNLAYYGSTNGGIYSVDVLVNSSEQLITNSPFVTGNINSMASNADNILVYYGSGTTVYIWDPQLGIGAASHQVLADLSAFPVFTGNGLQSSGGAYLDDVYYLAAEQDPTGGDIEDVYALQLSTDGQSVLSVTPLNVVAAALLDNPNYDSAYLGGFGDIITIVENGDVTIYGTSGDNFWKFNTATSDFTMINDNPPNNPPWQLFSNSAGQIFGAFQGSGTIFELDLTNGNSLGTTHTVPQFITDATGPLNCPPPIEICGNGTDDDGDGLIDDADPDCCITGALDTDNDGVIDCADECPTDPNKILAGICGCGNPEPGTACNDGDDDSAFDEIQPDCNCLGYTYDLALTKSNAAGNLVPGGNVTFTFTITNQGNVDAMDIVIVDYVPAGLTLNDANWSFSGGTATLLNPIDLAQNQTTTVTIDFDIDSDFQGASLNNIAEISSSSNDLGLTDVDSMEDSNPGNDIFGGNDEINNNNDDEDDHDEETTQITQTFDLALIKNGATGNFIPGGDITYSLEVFNQGTIDATNVVLVDYIPAGLNLDDTDWTASSGIATLNTGIPLIEPGQSVLVEITFEVDGSFTGTSVNNEAEISSSNNALNLPDSDSFEDSTLGNDTFGGNDEINNNNNDEDDHDEEITLICQDKIICPDNIVKVNDAGLCSAIVTFSAPLGDDNCLGYAVEQTSGLPSGSAFPVGTSTVEYTLTATGGAIETCLFTITITDDENPEITCPLDINVSNAVGQCGANVDYDLPTTSDNCPGETLVQTDDSGLSSGDFYPIGTTTIEYTVTDASGNTAVCSFDVTVNDTENPTISCPSNIMVDNDEGFCGAEVNYTIPEGTDNCPGATTIQTDASGLTSGDVFPIGTTTIEYTVTDASGNTAVCSFDVTVNDTENPTISCPSNITVNNDAGVCGAEINYAIPVGTDNCPGATTAQTDASGLSSGDVFPIGTTTIEFTVTDASGNTANCSFDITVNDTENPEITCPSNITVNNDEGVCGAEVSYTIPAGTDNCPGATTVQTDVSGLTSGDVFPIGTTTIEYTLTDASGNTAVCSFDVTVNDTENPTILCPSNITVNNDEGVCGAEVNYAIPEGTDNCPGATTVQTDVSGLTSGDVFPIGTTTIEFTVTDASGNTAVCSFDVTVNDTENPTILCPSNIIVNNDEGVCGAEVNYAIPEGTDNCPGATTTQTDASGLSSGDVFPIGTTTIEYTVTDASGNTANCSFDITVSEIEDPTITCPVDVAVDTDAGICTASGVDLGTPLTSDNCGVASLVNDAPSPFPLGTTTVTWTVTDDSGNTASCEQTVTVEDNEDPTITCSADVLVDADAGICTASGVDLGTPVTSDNCGIASVVNDAPSPFPLGTTTVTWTVTDDSGNTATCEQTVTVEDNEDPMITCPADVLVDTDGGICSASGVDLGTPLTSDNCGVASVVNDAPSPFPLGTTTVTWTVTDDSGNTASCEQTVTVEDNEDPTITCPADVLVDTDAGICTASGVDLGTPLTSDNCGVASVMNDAPSPFPLGTTTVTWTVTDDSGNTASCEQTVTVEDNEDPTITCPTDVLVDTDAGICTASGVDLGMPVTNDNCGVASVMNDAPSPLPLGTTTVTWIVTDNSGNTSTCEKTVTVEDNEDPTITCPADVVVNTDAGICTASGVDLGTPITNDNCGIASVVNDAPSPFPLGTTTVTWTVTDESENTATCEQTVAVEDNEDPTITCPGDVLVDTDAGICTASGVDLGTPVTNDNCGVASVVNDAPSPFPLGTTTVTWTVTDDSGNTATCEQTVTVEDNEDPMITCPSNITVNNDPGVCGATITFTILEGTDNCTGATTVQTAGLSSGSYFPVGTTVQTYVVTDAALNSATCSFTITVIDNEAPVLSATPASITVQCEDEVPSDPGISAIDNCNCIDSFIFTQSGLPLACEGMGTVTNNWTATDCNGNTVSYTQEITIADSMAPVLSDMLPNDTVQCITEALGDPGITANDNCEDIVDVVYQEIITNTDCPGEGEVEKTWTATDCAGNSTSHTQVIFINDTIAPEFSSEPADITVNCFDLVPGDPGITANDNCDTDVIVEFEQIDQTGICQGTGNVLNIWTVMDCKGNQSAHTQTVTVLDESGPTLSSMPADMIVSCLSDVPGDPGITATDNCDGNVDVTYVQNDSLLICSGDGVITNVWTSSDCAGNETSHIQVITIIDDTPPVFSFEPEDLSVQCITEVPGDPGVVATDACEGLVDVVYEQINLDPSSTCPGTGMYKNVWTAVDCANNEIVHEQIITVNDTTAPMLSAMPEDLMVECEVDVPGDPGITAFDNCQGPVSVTFTQTGLPLTCAGQGTVQNTWMAFDCAGNEVSYTQTITINDETDPVLSNMPTDITVECIQDVPGEAGISAIDNCDGPLTTNFVQSAFVLDSLCIGTMTNTWSAEDCSGNSVTHTQTVTIYDQTAPLLSAMPESISVNCGESIPGDPGITALDNCGDAVLVNFEQVGLPLACEGSGEVQNIWSAEDCNGNEVIHIQTITVVDAIAPVLGLNPTQFPDITVLCDVDVPGDPGITATDNCDSSIAVQFEQTGLPLACSGSGVVTNVWTATDCSGNSSSFTQTITINDTIPPGLSFLPLDTTVTCFDQIPGNLPLTAFDLCDSDPNIAFSQTSFDSACEGNGEVTNTWTVTDCAGNEFVHNQVVTVNDEIAPELLNLPLDTTVNCVGDVLAEQNVMAIDACGNVALSVTFTQSGLPLSSNGSGIVTNTWTAEDCNGNSISYSQFVTVNDTVPPVCMSMDTTIYLGANGMFSIDPSFIDNGSFDTCTDITLSLDENDFDCNEVGLNTISLIVSDENGNISTCPAIVTVVDSIAPMCIANDISIDIDASGMAEITVAQIDGGSTDECGIDQLLLSQTQFDCDDIPSVQVTLTVIDSNGNSSQCEALVTISDSIDPTITCPTDVLVDTDAGICTASGVDLGTPVTDDNCGIASVANDVPSPFPLGMTTVTWTVTDESGNTATCEQTVTVEDNEDPTITCPADVLVDTDAGICTASGVDLGTPITSDNCGIASVMNDAPSPFPLGITTVTWTVTDESGNTASCEQTVTVEDNEDPTITCPADVVVNTDAGICAASGVDLGTPITNDNCGVASVVNDAPSPFPLGMTTVTWTVTDDPGNTATCEQTVTVEDNEDPTITCPADVLVDTDAGICTASGVNLGTPVTSDNCGVASVTNDAPSPFPLGMTTVTWTVTDDSGNTATCEQTVTVEDNEDPTITCPADLIVDTDTGICTASGVDLGTPITSDNCGVASVVNDAPSPFPLGTTTVTWTVTDNSGNTATCEQTVTVEDNEDPTITCPTDLIVDTDAGICTASGVDLGTPLTSDNCGVASVTNDAPSPFPLGTTTVTWTVTDESGNIATCEQTVTVEDNEDPMITCPADVLADTDAGICTASGVDLGTPLTSDNCGVASVTNDAPSPLPIGTTTVTWTVTDDSGNTATCEQTVTVEDNEDPTITCPADLAVDTDAGICTASGVDLGTPLTSDNCGVASVVNDAPSPFPLGITTVTWTVTDDSGNTATCEQTVMVEDNEDPTITCPADVVVNTDAGICTASGVDLGTPVTSDNCGVASVLNDAPSPFPLGTITVTWTVTDDSGNTATCEQTVTVQDNEDPTITCPADVLVDTDAGICAASGVDLGTPLTSDNCGIASVVNDAPSPFPLGTTTVIWTVTDESGNTATCEESVTVEDNEDPTITCPADVLVDTDAGICTVSGVDLGMPVTNDNCGVASVVNDAPSPFPLGTTTVTWTVTDNSGNTATCEQTVTVEDNEDPTITCPADLIVDTDAGICTASGVDLGTPVASDNCGVASVMNDAPSPFPLGTTTVTWTVTDNSGNTATCEQTVTVEDNEDPTITCPENISVINDPSLCGAIVSYIVPIGEDNCTGVLTQQTDISGLSSGDLFPVGETTIEYTVTDASGNIAMCSFTVTVSDNEAPMCSAQDITIFVDQNVTVQISPLDIDNGSTDNCAISTYGLDQMDFDCNDLGLHSVELTITDIYGNSSSCSATVTVETDPFIDLECMAQDITVELDSDGMAIVSPAMIDVSNNCGDPQMFLNINQFDCSDVGVNPVELTISNDNSSVTCSANVTVVDPTVPECSAINATVSLDENGMAFINPSDVLDLSFSICETETIDLDRGSFNCNDLGPNPVSITVTSLDGSVLTCTSIVTVIDELDPSCNVQDETVYLDEDGFASLSFVDLEITTADNCGLVSLSISNNEFTCADLGIPQLLVLTANDVSGNSSLCGSTVTVLDTISPTCEALPNSFTISSAVPEIVLTENEITVASSDNCTDVSYDFLPSVLDCSNLGSNTIQINVTDENGNVGQCSTQVTISDEEDPTCVFENGTYYLNQSGFVIIDAQEVGSMSTDNCSIVDYDLDNPFINCGGPETNTLILTVTDQSGNTSSCSGEVVVLDTIFNGGSCMNVGAVLNNFEVTVPLSVLFNSTSCNPEFELFVDGSSEDLQFYCEDNGMNFVELEYVNANGESNTCTATVNVQDNSTPTISVPCQDVTASSNDCSDVFVEVPSPVFTDNCLETVSNSFNGTSNADGFYPVGVTEVVWTASDFAGNQVSCSNTVTVTGLSDVESPIINGPSNIVMDFAGDNGICESYVNIPLPFGIDDCGIDPSSWLVISDYVDPSNSDPKDASGYYPVGTSNVTWQVSDLSGNMASYSMTVTVNNIQAPQNLQANCSGNGQNMVFTWDPVQGAAGYKIIVRHVPGTGTPPLFGQVTQLNPNYVLQNASVNLFDENGTYEFRVITGCLMEEGLNPNNINNYNAAFSPWVQFTIDCSSNNPIIPNGENAISPIFELEEVKLVVYPNPSTGIINIESNRNIERLFVQDVLGKTYIDKKGIGQERLIDLSHLERNVYIIKVEIDGEIYIERVILQ